METAEFTATYLARFYGDKVRLEYYDMAEPGQQEKHKALLDQVEGQYIFYPLVFINDQLKVVGSAEYYDVLYAVREALE